MRKLVVFSFVLLLPAKAFAGYTHYWTWLAKPDPTKVTACLTDMEKVVRARPALVNDMKRGLLPRPSDEVVVRMREAGLPDLLDGEHIVFNGIGDDAHEDFRFPGALGFNFTKTEYKPYDEVVTAALIVARAHFAVEELEIASDGDWNAWAPGRRLYEKTFDKEPPNALLAAGEHVPSKRENWIISACVVGLGVVAWLVTRSRRRFG